MTVIIGMIGYANSGKSTLSREFSKDSKLNKVFGFSEPLYEMLMVLGVTEEQINDKELREQPLEILGGKSPIQAMISLGTEWGRNMVYPEIWVDQLKRRLTSFSGRVAFVENVRYQNEFDMVNSLDNSYMIYVNRPDLKPKLDRVSESEIHLLRSQCDYEIENHLNENSHTEFRSLIQMIRNK